jgi:Tol biopolymer transport system component
MRRTGLLALGIAAAMLSVLPAVADDVPSRLVYNVGLDGVGFSTADGTTARRIPNSREWLMPTWSPDGSRIAFSAGFGADQEIWIGTVDGEVIAQVTDNEANDQAPFWSPDGRRIGFWRGEDWPTLWTVRPDGSDPVRLTRTARSYHVRWSPNGRWIAYTGSHDGVSGIYAVRADGSANEDPVLVTRSGSLPMWSPDSSRVAVTRTTRIDGNWWSQFWAVPLDGTPEELLASVRGSSVTSPAWSPFGDRLAFIRSWDVWTVAVGGGDVQRVTDTGATEDFLDWGILPQCTLQGSDGPDVLEGTAGDDVICGGGGADRVVFSGGSDTILGGAGTDKVDYRESDKPLVLEMRSLRARSGDTTAALIGVEAVMGTPFDDQLFGADVRESLAGYGGDDALIGRGGDDTLNGGAGNDVLRPGLGGDDVNGGPDRDTVSFTDARDRVRVNLGSRFAFGQGDDILLELEKVIGSDFDDFIIGTDGPNVLRGGDGEDMLNGMEGPDDIYGGDDRDFLYGKGGYDELYGDGGRDYLDGGDEDDDCYSGYQTVAC